MNFLELLAPVGSYPALVAAVESGADAVYLAGKSFGARAYADNFGEEELAAAVRFAHLRGVLVYITVNTLVDTAELKELAAYLQLLDRLQVDAIIVQDLGVAALARRLIPQVPLHASTQMTIHNLAGVEYLAELGFSRAVLARELSLEEIRHICQHSPIEIEVFVHGALCISYSGQCLMSSMIGGRSGNRGRCAQPCRLPYTLVDREGNNVLADADAGEYLLSPKDFNTLDDMPDLMDAGVTSFKIEGRMKRPEYVAVVVDIYRRRMQSYLEGNPDASVATLQHKNLAQIFNRDFTTAYLHKKTGREMMSHRRPNNRGVRIGRVLAYDPAGKAVRLKLDEELHVDDIIEFWVKVGGRVNTTVTAIRLEGSEVAAAPAGAEVTVAVPSPVKAGDRVFKIFDARLMEYARRFFTGAAPVRRIPVKVVVEVAQGRPLVVHMQDGDGFTGQAATQFIAEAARNRPLTAETVAKQIERLGTTVFAVKQLECRIDGAVMVPLSEINDARRRAVEVLEEARLARFSRPAAPTVSARFPEPAGVKPVAGKKPELVVQVDTLEKVKIALRQGADRIMFGGETLNHQALSPEDYRRAVDLVRSAGKKIVLSTPRLAKEWQMTELRQELALFESLAPDAVAVANLGMLYLAREQISLPLHGDYPLNIYNLYTIQFLAAQQLASLTLSPELTFSQVEKLAGSSPVELECLVHGYLTLMVSEYCAVGSFLGQLHTGTCQQTCLKGQYWLKDRKGEQFPLATDQYCRMHVLNGKELSMLPHIDRFAESGISRLRIEGKWGSDAHLAEVVRLYRECIDLGTRERQRVQEKINAAEHEDITRGHYFRGVL